MKVIIHKKQNHIINISVFFIFIIIIAHFLKGLFENIDDGIISYVGYLFWLSLLVYAILSKAKLSRKWIILAIILVLNGLLGSIIYGKSIVSDGLSNFHQCLSFAVAILVATGANWSKRLDARSISRLMDVLVLLGLVASLYASIEQWDYMLNALRGINRGMNSWEYKSFFSQRNIFSSFCFICTVSATYLLMMTKKKKYLLYCICFVFQIYITDSRTALFSTFIFILLLLCFKSQSKVLFVVTAIIIALSVVFIIGIDLDFLVSRFSHITSEGIDSGEIRISMWGLGLSEIIKENALMTGFGMGAASEFLPEYYGYGSFHSVVIDLLFEGGLIQLGIYVYSQVYIFKRIYTGTNKTFRDIMMAAFFAYCFYCILESGLMMFSSRYFSIVITVLFAILPQYYMKD